MRTKTILIFILLFIHVAFWFILKPTTPFSDDKVYTMNAETLIHGDYHLNESPKNHRVMVFAPTALFIKLFGENPFAISLWTLLCSLITITCLFLFLSKHSGLVIAFIASFFIACNNLQIIYSAALFPDVIVALFAFLFISTIYNARIKDVHETQNAIVATLFFLSGFLAKEIILIVLPFTVFVFIDDWRKKVHLKFWKRLLLSMLSATVILNAFYFFISGDINFIYHCINKNHNEVFALFSYSELLKRYTYDPLIFLFNSVGYSIPIAFFLCFLMIRKSFVKDSNQRGLQSLPIFFSIYFIILLMSYWWIPTSFNHLSPILLFGFERMWMLLLIPLSIVAAITVVKIIEDKSSKSLIILSLIFILATIVSWIFISPHRAIYFFIFAISAALSIILKEKTKLNKKIIIAILILPLFIEALYFTIQNSNLMVH